MHALLPLKASAPWASVIVMTDSVHGDLQSVRLMTGVHYIVTTDQQLFISSLCHIAKPELKNCFHYLPVFFNSFFDDNTGIFHRHFFQKSRNLQMVSIYN